MLLTLNCLSVQILLPSQITRISSTQRVNNWFLDNDLYLRTSWSLTWLTPSLYPFQLPVHPSSFKHIYKEFRCSWILTLECLLMQVSETCKASYSHSFTFVTFDDFWSFFTTEACKTIAVAIPCSSGSGIRISTMAGQFSFLAGTSVSNLVRLYRLFRIHSLVSLLKNLVFAASRLFFLICIGFLFNTE